MNVFCKYRYRRKVGEIEWSGESNLFLATGFPNSSPALEPLFWIQILSLICKSPGRALKMSARREEGLGIKSGLWGDSMPCTLFCPELGVGYQVRRALLAA